MFRSVWVHFGLNNCVISAARRERLFCESFIRRYLETNVGGVEH